MFYQYVQKKLKNRKRKFEYKQGFKNNFLIEPYYSTDYNSPSAMDLITVSFNAPQLINYQIKLVKK